MTEPDHVCPVHGPVYLARIQPPGAQVLHLVATALTCGLYGPLYMGALIAAAVTGCCPKCGRRIAPLPPSPAQD